MGFGIKKTQVNVDSAPSLSRPVNLQVAEVFTSLFLHAPNRTTIRLSSLGQHED